MAITLNGDTGLTLPASSSITGSSTTLTGITSVASNAADTPVILQDSSSNSNTCRAWVNFQGTGTVTIRRDFNVSSITDNGTGNYNVNFSEGMSTSNYAAIASHSLDQEIRVDAYGPTTFRIVSDSTVTDAGTVTAAVFI